MITKIAITIIVIIMIGPMIAVIGIVGMMTGITGTTAAISKTITATELQVTNSTTTDGNRW
ncbi:hypothetical protein CfE428DRAFT_0319 [Chthoniobacter flavus Ellin428]|uniref:Uncharacterized protein n=1 Tax=Chthoniobacter flavus Ellin428 TaxID=497964 RepID=B4CUF6_9BACT|nr:hypothetical protein CfE428DRAFT_0319 [Chthoniobacter flavus Ellin428]TCO94777.1 hypothetical protein EV701_102246 [Chthoniobacter flavus]